MTTDGCFPLPLESAVGESIWQFVRGATARRMLSTLYRRVREQNATLFVPLRGDLPDRRRLLDLRLQPVGEGAIAHTCDCVWSESRAIPVLFDASRVGQRTLDQCPFCHRVKVARDDWREVEDACLILRLERAQTLPSLEQTVCFGCQRSLLKSVAAHAA